MSENDKIFTKEDAFQTLTLINSWIVNVDTKISFALAFIAVLLGSIFSSGLPKAFKAVSTAKNLSDISGCQYLSIALVVSLYLCSLCVIWFLFLGIKARVKNPTKAKSMFFFGSISARNLDDYKEELKSLSENQMIEDFAEQIHTNSQICAIKVKYYNLALSFLRATLGLWFICMVFQLI